MIIHNKHLIIQVYHHHRAQLDVSLSNVSLHSVEYHDPTVSSSTPSSAPSTSSGYSPAIVNSFARQDEALWNSISKSSAHSSPSHSFSSANHDRDHFSSNSFLVPSSSFDSMPTQGESSLGIAALSEDYLPSYKNELYLLFQLAYPVSLSFLCRITMAITDLAFLGHLSTDYLAAASVAIVWMNITSAFLSRSFGSALNTLCTQAFNNGNMKMLGVYLQQALILSTFNCFPIALLWWFTEPIVSVIGINEDTASLAGTFARYSIIWLWPLNMYDMLQKYMQSQNIVISGVVINFIFVFINFLFNLLFIYGVGSFNGLGYIGSVVATATTRYFILFFYFYYIFIYKKYHKLTWFGWDLKLVFNSELLYIFVIQQVLPLIIGVSLEEWQLELIAIFAARLGDTQITTHNATLEIFFALSAVMLGLMTATMLRISHYLSNGRPESARRIAILAYGVSIVIGVVVFMLFSLLRNYIGYIYSNDPDVISTTSSISIVVGGCFISLSIFYTSMAILDGEGRPGIVALSFLVGAWLVSVPAAYIFAVVLNYDLIGLWYGLLLGYSIVAIIISIIAINTDWKLQCSIAIQRNKQRNAAAAGNNNVNNQNNNGNVNNSIGVKNNVVNSGNHNLNSNENAIKSTPSRNLRTDGSSVSAEESFYYWSMNDSSSSHPPSIASSHSQSSQAPISALQ